jgi:hypothetical protein
MQRHRSDTSIEAWGENSPLVLIAGVVAVAVAAASALIVVIEMFVSDFVEVVKSLARLSIWRTMLAVLMVENPSKSSFSKKSPSPKATDEDYFTAKSA